MKASIVLALVLSGNPIGRAEVVWPDPPEPARIRYLRSITPAALAGKPSFFSRVWGAIVGERKQPFMVQPYGICLTRGAQLCVADTFGRALHIYDLEKGDYRAVPVDGDSLIGVASLRDRLVVTDSSAGRVLCLDAKGKRVWAVGQEAGLKRPTGIAADGERLRVVDTLANEVVTLSGDGAVVGRFGARGRGPGQFNSPTNITVGPDGKLYVCDSMNFRVQIFDAAGVFISQFGKPGDGSGDFSKPKGIAVDSDGNIYVVEGINDVIQIFDRTGRLLLFFGGSGTGEGELWLPTGIAIHRDKIYVADSSNRRVQMFEYVKEGP